MKILFLTVRSDYGGGPRHVDQILKELSTYKFDIFLACPVGEPYGELWRENLDHTRIFMLPYRKISLISLYRLKKFIEKNDITIIHSHGNGAGIYSRLLKLLTKKVRVIHTFHGLTNNYSSTIKFMLNKILIFVFRFLTDKYICVSEGELQLAREMNAVDNSRVSVIYNGIESQNSHASWSEDIFNVMTLSRFDYQKNMELAFDLAKMFNSKKNFNFIWVGDGPQFSMLKKRAQIEGVNNIDFIGFSNEPMKYLLKSQAYLSTSRFEGLPYSLIEAASVGLPIVSTDVIGNNEVVINNYNGYLFDQISDAFLGLEILRKNKNDWLQKSSNSKKLFEDNFTIDRMINKLINIYIDE